jgi:hypothetical protein
VTKGEITWESFPFDDKRKDNTAIIHFLRIKEEIKLQTFIFEDKKEDKSAVLHFRW